MSKLQVFITFSKLVQTLKAGFHMIATIVAIAGKNVQQSLQLGGKHFLAIATITAIIWKPAYMACSAIKVAPTVQRFR